MRIQFGFPGRTLSLPVFKSFDTGSIDQSLRNLVDPAEHNRTGFYRIVCFGSTTRCDWGLGSDPDIIIRY